LQAWQSPANEKFVAMSELMEKAGRGRMRVMTDVVGERYWTIVSEFEVESLDAFEKMMSDQAAAKGTLPGVQCGADDESGQVRQDGCASWPCAVFRLTDVAVPPVIWHEEGR
jgi:hypothetical protein